MKLARLLHYLWHPRMIRRKGYRKDNIMAYFNIDSLRSYAVAAIASVYCSVMLLAVAGQNGAQVGSLVI